MARSNGPYGPAGARPPARRLPGDDQAHGANGQWPTAPFPDQGQAPPQHGQGYHFPAEPEPNYGYSQSAAPPYDRYQNGAQQQPYPPQQQQQWGQPDPRGYDLGSYMPSTPQQPYPPADHGHYQQGQDHFQQGPDHPFNGQRQGYAETDAEYEDEFAEGEEPSGGRRWLFIAAIALVGAVGVGGAVAYTYKSLSAPSRVPIVTKDAAKDKMPKRVADEAPLQNSAPAVEDDRTDENGGPRRVKTIAINPNAPQVTGSPPPSPQVGAAPMVPGIMLDNMRPPQQLPPPPAKTAQAMPPRVVIGTPPPQMMPPQQVQPQVEQAPPAVKKTAAVVPAPTQAPPAVVPKQPVKHAPAPSANAASGYVAVLSSQKSRMDALKVFADLQQKYPDALTGKVPDVQEKDLSERNLGTMFRLVVGPPGSRAAASTICNQLKTAGHEGCWVTEY